MARTQKKTAKKAPSKRPVVRTRARPKERRNFSYFFLCLFVVAVLVGGAAYGGYHFNRYVRESERFLVKHVRVEGANVLREEGVLAVAAVTSADNVWLLDVPRIEERIAAIPYVRRCRVLRIYPDTVVIRLTERVAYAVLHTNNHCYEVDEEGVVLREVNALAPTSLPMITNVPELGVISSGQHLDSEALKRAIAVWRMFSATPMAESVTLSELSAADKNEIVMFLDEVPCKILWGRYDFGKQAGKLNVLWDTLQGEIPYRSYIDLRFDGDIVCR